MPKDRCDFCGKDFLRAAVSSTDTMRSRARGDDVVAGLASYLEGIQSGVAPLEECVRCGKTYCRTCAENAGASSGEGSYPCPGCVAYRRTTKLAETSPLEVVAAEKGPSEPRYLSLKEIMAARKAAQNATAASPSPAGSQKPVEPLGVGSPAGSSPQAVPTSQAESLPSVDPDEFKRLVEKHLKTEKPLKYVQITEHISSDRLEKARERIAPNMREGETPIILFDTSPHSSNLTSGLLATDRGLYWRNEDKQNKTYSCGYDQLRKIYAGKLTFMNGRTCYLEKDILVIPIVNALVGDALISFLQIAAKQTPLQSEEETERKISESQSFKGLAKDLGAVAFLLLLLAIVVAVIWAFVANPRMLAPIALGIVVLAHSSSKNAFVKLTDFIVWLGMTIATWNWIMDGF